MASLVVVSRYIPKDIQSSPSNGEPILDGTLQRNDSLDDFNHPRYRRARILQELNSKFGSDFSFIKPFQPSKNLSSYWNVQSQNLIDFFERAWEEWDSLGPEGQDPASSLPQSFDEKNRPRSLPLIPGNTPLPRDPFQRPSNNVMGKIGYYCTDTCTPIFAELKEELEWDAAVLKLAIDSLTSEKNGGLVYALATHPGHHAAYDSFGGYCYLNHAAFAARELQQRCGHSKVAILDVDYHCGNGTASIFYRDPTVLVVSIHCDPDYEYPFHSGFEDQTGAGEGEGTTLHLPLPPGTKWDSYSLALERAMTRIQSFGAEALMVSLGVDTHKGDPCAIRRAGFSLEGRDYSEMGQWIGSYCHGIPILFIQEGGYFMEHVPGAVASVLKACSESK